jgi:hypothetical protein
VNDAQARYMRKRLDRIEVNTLRAIAVFSHMLEDVRQVRADLDAFNPPKPPTNETKPKRKSKTS